MAKYSGDIGEVWFLLRPTEFTSAVITAVQSHTDKIRSDFLVAESMAMRTWLVAKNVT